MIRRDLRHEIKQTVSRGHRDKAERWLRSHSLFFVTQYPSRQVNNIYFDTHDLKAFYDNLAGISRRHKTRFRWYGPLKIPDSGTLEIKFRVNQLGGKDSIPISGLAAEAGNWTTIQRQMREKLDGRFRVFFDHAPVPVLVNTYMRSYFISGDGNIRVTLDHDMTYYNQQNRTRPNLNEAAIRDEKCVIEVKFEQNSWQAVSGLLEGFPGRPSKHSKYCSGVRAVLLFG